MDTDGPARILQSSSTTTTTGMQVRVVLTNTSEYAFGKIYRRRKRRDAIRQQDAAQWDAVTQAAKPRKSGKKLIVIDPGHGGVDSGAIASSRTMEKDVVLAFSHALRKALERTGRYVVDMTRRGDVYVPLRARVRFARRHSADLFISVHADIVADKLYSSISGTTLYTLSEDGSDAAAREFAARENTSDIIAGVDLPEQANAVANILIDLAQRETNSRSEKFAQAALGQIRKATKLSRGPHRSAAFRVLKAPDVPSLLIELGYLSNKDDETRLRSPKWRADVAQSLVRSVAKYFAGQTSIQPY
jgi:N-acetylmuramoyl-L-alanine amidase